MSHKRKRVVVALTPAEQNDPKSIIKATRRALKEQAKLTYVVRTVPGESNDPPVEAEEPSERRMPLEQLETAALDLAAEVLKQKKVEAAAPKAPTEPEPPKKGTRWWRAVKASGRAIGWAVKEGFKLTVGEVVKAVSGGKAPPT
jgi:hypothetical protein